MVKNHPNGWFFYAPISNIKSQLALDTATAYNGDLNNISKTSIYYADSPATNKPEGVNGYVSTIVANSNYISQHYTTYDGQDFRRVKNGGTWGSWLRVDTCETSNYSSGSNYWTERKYGSGVLEIFGVHTCSGAETDQRGNYGGIYVWDADVNITFNTPFKDDYYFINAYPDSNGYMWFTYRDGSNRNALSTLSFGANYAGPYMARVEFFLVGYWR